jgi:hypothetical protein
MCGTGTQHPDGARRSQSRLGLAIPPQGVAALADRLEDLGHLDRVVAMMLTRQCERFFENIDGRLIRAQVEVRTPDCEEPCRTTTGIAVEATAHQGGGTSDVEPRARSLERPVLGA